MHRTDREHRAGGQPSRIAFVSLLAALIAVADASGALAAGATSERAPRDEFYGDRMAGVRDAFGNTWWFATHKEDLPEAEMVARAAERAASSA